jgi:nitronate monooxygenase
MFLASDPATQVATFSLVPQIVDAVSVPVIAAGGVSDGRGVAAALVLGASAVMVGTAYLLCPESRLSTAYRAALDGAADDSTVLTNVMTGRPARGIANRIMRDLGPISPDAPAFPRAATPLAPLRAKAEAQDSGDFSPLWAGQSVGLCTPLPAAELTRRLAQDAAKRLAAVR